jgi:succinoglycan biosynthesis transport protein ExoP
MESSHSNLQPYQSERSSGLAPLDAPIPIDSYDEGEFNLKQLLLILRRRVVLISAVAIAVTSVAGYNALTQTSEYQGGFRLLVEPVTTENQLDELTRDSQTGQRSITLDYATQIEVLRSPALLRPIIQRIQTQYPEVDYGALVSQLTVTQPKETKILDVRYQDPDPQKVKFVLDQLAQGYLRYSQQERQSNLRQGVAFVGNQLPTLRQRVDSLQRQLQTFRQQNNFIDPESLSGQVNTQITSLEQQRLDVQKQLSEAQKLYTNLQGETGAVAALAGSQTYQQLLSQMRDLDAKIATESVRFQNGNPAMDALQEQKQKLMPLVRQEASRVLGNRLAEVDSQLSLLEVRQREIAKAENYWNGQLKRLPVTARQYTDLQRELKVATESLNRFLETRENLQVQAAQKEIPWQLIATPEVPAIPLSSAWRNLILGIVGGLFAGVGAALLAERLDNTFHSLEDLKKQVKLPVLGVIPFYEVESQSRAPSRVTHLFRPKTLKRLFRRRPRLTPHTHSLFLEAFRSLHANIRLLRAEPSIASLVISSSLPGDGKSTVSVNLAQAAAAMGQRVLLVDADLRKPRISHLLGLDNSRGLSDLIATDLHPNQAIQQIHRTGQQEFSEFDAEIDQNMPFWGDNLFVLTSGQIPADPTKLLSSPKMQQLVEHFQTLFDLVIYDTPPLINLADSSLLAPSTDGIILVAGLGKTDRAALAEAIGSLRTSRIPVLGVVANNLRSVTVTAVSQYYYQA